jgi:hypothetical protein
MIPCNDASLLFENVNQLKKSHAYFLSTCRNQIYTLSVKTLKAAEGKEKQTERSFA